MSATGRASPMLAAETQCDVGGGVVANDNALAPAISDREVMSVIECAAFLGVDRKTVYDYAARGVLPCARLGRRILFSRQALVLWLGGACSKGPSNGDTR